MFGLISDRIYILFEIIVPYMYCKTNGNIVIHVRIVSPCKYRDMYRYGKHCRPSSKICSPDHLGVRGSVTRQSSKVKIELIL